MGTVIAICDACVLYPAPLRDLLLHLAVQGLFHARWTEQIHEEWLSKLLSNRPDLSRERLQRTRDLMDQAVPDALVTGHEDLIAELSLPDPDDRHVLAAAIRAEAETIITYNTSDFPRSSLDVFGVTATHPDSFILSLLNHDRDAVCDAAGRHRASLKNPAKTVDEYLDTLLKQQLPRTVARLRDLSNLL